MKTIQDVLTALHKDLNESIGFYDDGLVCPREHINSLIDKICTAAELTNQVSCSQTWKPCLTDSRITCACKEHAQGSDVVGKCPVCKKDVYSNDSFDVTDDGLENVRHKACR